MLTTIAIIAGGRVVDAFITGFLGDLATIVDRPPNY
ncbi:hypothetical protein GGD67_002834 [Bradyrhizobium sp. IAR9]|nr:hypothetical protein [Bradyrhizobium sp. IAR9]